MKTIRFTTLAIMLATFNLFSQNDKPAYRLFDKNGAETSYARMIADFSTADVVFVGEYHNNPISHWMEYEIGRSLSEKKNGKIILGAEMFEADQQLPLTEYVNGIISTSRFEADTRLWDNYKTDYSPLVEFARENKIPFIATNIPRRYADVVNKLGGETILNGLPDEARRYIAPLPIPLKPDSTMIEEWARLGMHPDSSTLLAMAKSQAVKDATMAHFIARHAGKGKLFIHFNGNFHSDNSDGIIYFLKKYNPALKVKTLSTAQQKNISSLEHDYAGKADYILCVPESMTKTY